MEMRRNWITDLLSLPMLHIPDRSVLSCATWNTGLGRTVTILSLWYAHDACAMVPFSVRKCQTSVRETFKRTHLFDLFTQGSWVSLTENITHFLISLNQIEAKRQLIWCEHSDFACVLWFLTACAHFCFVSRYLRWPCNICAAFLSVWLILLQ